MERASEDARGEREGRRRPRPPLDEAALSELALAYAARFATTRAKLATYLTLKVRERGWGGARDPDPLAIAGRMVEAGFVDDRAYAEMKSGALLRRGYGARRVRAALSAAGVGEEERAGALASAEEGGLVAALRFAERKRIGPYALAPLDRPQQERALAAMIRAGHAFGIARRVVGCAPGEMPEQE